MREEPHRTYTRVRDATKYIRARARVRARESESEKSSKSFRACIANNRNQGVIDAKRCGSQATYEANNIIQLHRGLVSIIYLEGHRLLHAEKRAEEFGRAGGLRRQS